jgi:hypothetical protein
MFLFRLLFGNNGEDIEVTPMKTPKKPPTKKKLQNR